MNCSEIIGHVLHVLNQFEGVDRDRWSNDEWTQTIQTSLSSEGQRLDYFVYVSNVDSADCVEWHYDVAWLEQQSRLKSVPMVAACVLGSTFETILDEFEKLLVARAALRVLVCDGGCLPGVEDIEGRDTIEILQEWIQEFEGGQIDDTYLIVIYDCESKKRRSWRYRLSVNGSGESPSLERL